MKDLVENTVIDQRDAVEMRKTVTGTMIDQYNIVEMKKLTAAKEETETSETGKTVEERKIDHAESQLGK